MYNTVFNTVASPQALTSHIGVWTHIDLSNKIDIIIIGGEY